MKKTILPALLLCLLAFAQAGAQNRSTDSSVTCIAFWKNKDTKVYQIKHSKERNSGKGLQSGAATYDAHIRITDSSANGFTLEWVFRNFRTEGSADEMTRSLGAAIEGMTIKYTTDEMGSFSELLNWEEVRGFAIGNVEKALNAITQNSEYKVALDQLKKIFQSKQNIETLLIREVKIFHAPFGAEYDKKGTATATLLPNVTGGDPFPATVTAKLRELNTGKDYAVVNVDQVIDKKKAAPIMAALLKKLAGTKPVSEDEIKKQLNGLEISDLNTYKYALSDGWIMSITYKRIANVGTSMQTETYQISAVD